MQTLAAAIQTFNMQDPIDIGCFRSGRLIVGRKAALKCYRQRALAQEARPMTGGERARLKVKLKR
jgi:hypothetical protein